ncbi:MAG: peptidoglycan-binding protein, partial [Actinomycetota bacterium]|nr:peptidoglycan-binding protein [Actinomycetota bacterium]
LEQALPGRRADPATRALPDIGAPAYAATRTMPGPVEPASPTALEQEPIWGPPPAPYRPGPPRRSRASVVALVVLALALAGAAATAIVLAGGGDKSGSAAGPSASAKPSTPGSSPAGQPTPTPTPSQGGGPATAWPALSQGSSGAQVTAAQLLLRYRGRDINVNGKYGGAMAKVVRDFQHDNGLAASGDIDAPTWSALTTTVRRGDNNDAVKAVQHLLNRQGKSLAVDGDYGAETEAAVNDFQRSHGLTTDGVVGTQTWMQLLSDDA